MSVSEDVLNKIKNDNVKPYSNLWVKFSKFASYLVLATGITMIIIAAGIAAYNVIESFSLVSMIIVPVLIAVIFAIFVFIILFQKIVKSDEFYKFARFKFAGFLLGLIIAGGIIWNVSGAAKAADIALQENRQYCETMKKAVYVKWSSPEEGYLAGEVQEKPVSPQTFTLKDLRRHIWTIQPLVEVNFIDRGNTVKLQGEITGPSVFRANHIDLWEGKMWFDLLDGYYSTPEIKQE